jgi:hypothetical protein
MDSYVVELEKQNEALKQMLSQCQRKVETLETKVWKWYDVKIVDQGSMTSFFTETNLEEVVFKILYPMIDVHLTEEHGKSICIRCYVGSLLIWKHDLTRRKSTDGAEGRARIGSQNLTLVYTQAIRTESSRPMLITRRIFTGTPRD